MSAIVPVTASLNSNAVPSYQANPFVTGFNISVTGNTTLSVSPGAAVAFGSSALIQYPQDLPGLPVTLSADISTTGVNGCYPLSLATLALANDTIFPLYVISNSAGTTNGSLNPDSGTIPALVVATGSNFLPKGFDQFRRIGYVFVAHSTGHLIPVIQSGKSNDRLYMFDYSVLALSAGAATTATGVDLTALDGLIPPKKGVEVIFGSVLVGNAAAAYLQTFPTNGNALFNQAGAITPVAAQPFGTQFVMAAGLNNSSNASIDYLVNNAGTSSTLYVNGFVDSLDALLY